MTQTPYAEFSTMTSDIWGDYINMSPITPMQQSTMDGSPGPVLLQNNNSGSDRRRRSRRSCSHPTIHEISMFDTAEQDDYCEPKELPSPSVGSELVCTFTRFKPIKNEPQFFLTMNRKHRWTEPKGIFQPIHETRCKESYPFHMKVNLISMNSLCIKFETHK